MVLIYIKATSKYKILKNIDSLVKYRRISDCGSIECDNNGVRKSMRGTLKDIDSGRGRYKSLVENESLIKNIRVYSFMSE